MAEGESRSEVSREEAHGHIEHEPGFFKAIRKLFAPLGFLQPDDGDVYIPPEEPKQRDPLEDTPEEEEREFEHEKLGGAPSSV